MPETIVEQETETKDATDTPWNVVVHNDPGEFDELCDARFPQGLRLLEGARGKAHARSASQRAVRSSGAANENAREAYVQQLHGYLLLATIEKAE
jgi:hypothetical protein